MPGQRQQLSETASTAEGTKILHSETWSVIDYRSIWIAELYRPDRGSGQSDRRQFTLSAHLVVGRPHERQCDLER